MIKSMLAGVLSIGIACTAGAQQSAANNQPPFTAKERNEVIDTLIAKLDSVYVYREVAKKMTGAVRLHEQNHGL